MSEPERGSRLEGFSHERLLLLEGRYVGLQTVLSLLVKSQGRRDKRQLHDTLTTLMETVDVHLDGLGYTRDECALVRDGFVDILSTMDYVALQ